MAETASSGVRKGSAAPLLCLALGSSKLLLTLQCLEVGPNCHGLPRSPGSWILATQFDPGCTTVSVSTYHNMCCRSGNWEDIRMLFSWDCHPLRNAFNAFASNAWSTGLTAFKYTVLNIYTSGMTFSKPRLAFSSITLSPHLFSERLRHSNSAKRTQMDQKCSNIVKSNQDKSKWNQRRKA